MQTLSTLGSVLSFLSRYAGGTIPPTEETNYAEWVSWINEGQEDAAERGFWGRLLTPYELDISAGEEEVILPDDFHKRNGIFVLNVNGIDWNANNNSDGQKLFVYKNTDSEWILRFNGFTPTEDITAMLWYFRHPGVLEEETENLTLDGKMVGYYALTEYYRQAGEEGSLDDARDEYNNRFEELLGLEMLPSTQELLSWNSFYSHKNISTNERNFYTRNRNRRT